MQLEPKMIGTVSLSRSSFSRGVNEVLTMKPLRDAASSVFTGKQRDHKTESSTTSARTVTVVKNKNSGWHVKKTG
jgi:hypothetical protein